MVRTIGWIVDKSSEQEAKEEAKKIYAISRFPLFRVSINDEIAHLNKFDFTEPDYKPLLIDKVFFSSQQLKESAYHCIDILNWHETDSFDFAVMPMQIQSQGEGFLLRLFIKPKTYISVTYTKVHSIPKHIIFAPRLQTKIGKLKFVPERITFVDLLLPAKNEFVRNGATVVFAVYNKTFINAVLEFTFTFRGSKPQSYNGLKLSNFVDIPSLSYITPGTIKQIASIIFSENKRRKVKIGYTAGTVMYFCINMLCFIAYAFFNEGYSIGLGIGEMILIGCGVFNALILVWYTSLLKRIENFFNYGLFSFNSRIPSQKWMRDYCEVSRFWEYEDWKKEPATREVDKDFSPSIQLQAKDAKQVKLADGNVETPFSSEEQEIGSILESVDSVKTRFEKIHLDMKSDNSIELKKQFVTVIYSYAKILSDNRNYDKSLEIVETGLEVYNDLDDIYSQKITEKQDEQEVIYSNYLSLVELALELVTRSKILNKFTEYRKLRKTIKKKLARIEKIVFYY